MVLAMTSSDNVFRALELQGMTSIGGRVDYLREISAAQLVAVLAKNNLVIRCEAVN